MFTEDSLQNVIEKGDSGAKVHIHQRLVHVVVPVLLVVPEGVDRTKRSGLLIGEFDSCSLRRLSQHLLEPNRATRRLVKNVDLLLVESGFEEHLEGMLSV